MTENVKWPIPLNKGDFYETHAVYRLALIHSTCSSNPTIWAHIYPHTNHCPTPLQERHFTTTLRHVVKQPCVETEQRYLCRVLHFNRQNLMLISPPKWPNDEATAYGTYWIYPTEQ